MRIHIENQSNKIEECENSIIKMQQSFEDEFKEIKREKRRLDDLLTIREDELEKIKDMDTNMEKRGLEKD